MAQGLDFFTEFKVVESFQYREGEKGVFNFVSAGGFPWRNKMDIK
jgi:hypothetical protein